MREEDVGGRLRVVEGARRQAIRKLVCVKKVAREKEERLTTKRRTEKKTSHIFPSNTHTQACAACGSSPRPVYRPLHTVTNLFLFCPMLRISRTAALRSPPRGVLRRQAPHPLPRPCRRLQLLPPRSSPPSDAPTSPSPTGGGADADAAPADDDAFTRAWMRALLLCWFAAQVSGSV